MIRLCKHVKEDGVSCGSPAVRGERYCCHHLRYKGYALRTWRVRDPQPWRLRLLPLTSLSAIQTNLDRVARAEDAGHLTPRTAGLMRYGLHLAASSLRFVESRNIAVGTANKGEPNGGATPPEKADNK